MNVLWDEGSATVHEALDVLEEDYLYTSLLTVFQTLEDNGYVTHEREGRAYRYYPEIEREDAERSVLTYVMSNVFQGSPERLLNRLLEDEGISRQEADELRDLLDSEAED